jgi:hypothetical protein
VSRRDILEAGVVGLGALVMVLARPHGVDLAATMLLGLVPLATALFYLLLLRETE